MNTSAGYPPIVGGGEGEGPGCGRARLRVGRGGRGRAAERAQRRQQALQLRRDTLQPRRRRRRRRRRLAPARGAMRRSLDRRALVRQRGQWAVRRTVATHLAQATLHLRARGGPLPASQQRPHRPCARAPCLAHTRSKPTGRLLIGSVWRVAVRLSRRAWGQLCAANASAAPPEAMPMSKSKVFSLEGTPPPQHDMPACQRQGCERACMPAPHRAPGPAPNPPRQHSEQRNNTTHAGSERACGTCEGCDASGSTSASRAAPTSYARPSAAHLLGARASRSWGAGCMPALCGEAGRTAVPRSDQGPAELAAIGLRG